MRCLDYQAAPSAHTTFLVCTKVIHSFYLLFRKGIQSNCHSMEIPVIKECVVVVRRAQVCLQVGYGHGVWNRVPFS